MSVVSSRAVRSFTNGRRRRVCGLVIVGWVVAVAAAAAADQAAAQKRTTKSRVYTTAQAARGESTYMTMCVSCHPPATYKGAVFLQWQGRTLAELLAFLQEKMPKSDPGSLTAEEYTDIIAYLLKLNTMPAGRSELPTDVRQLRTIAIDIVR